MANAEGQTNTFILLKSFDHLNSSQANKAASRRRLIKKIQRVLASAQPVQKCSAPSACTSMQPSAKPGVTFTAADVNDGKVYEIDNSFNAKQFASTGSGTYLSSHVVTPNHTVGGFPARKVSVVDNKTKQTVFTSSKAIIDIRMPDTAE